MAPIVSTLTLLGSLLTSARVHVALPAVVEQEQCIPMAMIKGSTDAPRDYTHAQFHHLMSPSGSPACRQAFDTAQRNYVDSFLRSKEQVDDFMKLQQDFVATGINKVPDHVEDFATSLQVFLAPESRIAARSDPFPEWHQRLQLFVDHWRRRSEVSSLESRDEAESGDGPVVEKRFCRHKCPQPFCLVRGNCDDHHGRKHDPNDPENDSYYTNEPSVGAQNDSSSVGAKETYVVGGISVGAA